MAEAGSFAGPAVDCVISNGTITPLTWPLLLSIGHSNTKRVCPAVFIEYLSADHLSRLSIAVSIDGRVVLAEVATSSFNSEDNVVLRESESLLSVDG